MNQNLKKSKLIWLGTIVNTHGLKGELRIVSDSDEIESRFKIGNRLFVKELEQVVEIEKSRIHKNFVLIFLKGFNNINQVEKFKGKKIYIEVNFEQENENVEFYYSDLIGFIALDINKEKIGTIKSYFNQGPYESYSIEIDKNRFTNIPILDKFIKEIDYEHNQVIFNVLKRELV